MEWYPHSPVEIAGCKTLLIIPEGSPVISLFSEESVVTYQNEEELRRIIDMIERNSRAFDSYRQKAYSATLQNNRYEHLALKILKTVNILRHSETIGDSPNQSFSTGSLVPSDPMPAKFADIRFSRNAAVVQLRQNLRRFNSFTKKSQNDNIKRISCMVAPVLRNGMLVIEYGSSGGVITSVIGSATGYELKSCGITLSKEQSKLVTDLFPHEVIVDSDNPLRITPDLCICCGGVSAAPDITQYFIDLCKSTSPYILMLSVEICRMRPTFFVSRNVESVTILEGRYNEQEFIEKSSECGLEIVDSCVLDDSGENDRFRTAFLFRNLGKPIAELENMSQMRIVDNQRKYQKIRNLCAWFNRDIHYGTTMFVTDSVRQLLFGYFSNLIDNRGYSDVPLSDKPEICIASECEIISLLEDIRSQSVTWLMVIPDQLFLSEETVALIESRGAKRSPENGCFFEF